MGHTHIRVFMIRVSVVLDPTSVFAGCASPAHSRVTNVSPETD